MDIKNQYGVSLVRTIISLDNVVVNKNMSANFNLFIKKELTMKTYIYPAMLN